MNFLGSLVIGLAVYSIFIYLFGIDWLSVLVTLAIFIILRQRLGFNASGYWVGELISLVAFDILGLYIAASIQLPLYVQNPAYAIGQMAPALLGSLAALLYFRRKKNLLPQT